MGGSSRRKKVKNNDFLSLGVSSFHSDRLKEKNIAVPSEIQSRVIPLLLKRNNVLFRSATGTGKTFAYLLPILHSLMNGGTQNNTGPSCVIAAPTHELCSQIKQETDFLLSGTKFKAVLLIGSAQIGRQIEALKKDKPAIVIGNPGRLLSLASERKLKLNNIEFLVLDEGDRLVSDELMEETSSLVSLIAEAKHRQNPADSVADNYCFVACSATFSDKTRERLFSLPGAAIAAKIKYIETTENILKELVEHWAIFSDDRDKILTLRSLIVALKLTKKKAVGKNSSIGKVLIFTARGRDVANITAKLRHFNLDAAGLWGDMDRKVRKQSLDDFRSGKVRLLVTSDLAARGLDIQDIEYVIALDTAENPDQYIHRVGRTARAGKTGIMITIGDEVEMRRLSVLEKRLGMAVNPKELFEGKITKCQ